MNRTPGAGRIADPVDTDSLGRADGIFAMVGNTDPSVIDIHVNVSSEEARAYCHELAGCGLFVGQSSGACMAAAAKTIEMFPDARVVTLLNDIGERYGSTGL
ncbi:MAG: pyridoxal-phosphate dependent enzyme, partial [Acidobacteria bacterium]|nr:pyridoxal-phosphate dependent enzyme [Acidobacteriota bacterium]